MRIDRNVFIVTGGASGFGSALTLALLERKARVVICDLNLAALERFISSLQGYSSGIDFMSLAADVTDRFAMQTVFDEAVRVFGRINCVVNNAGIAETRLFADDITDEWNRVLDVDLRAVILNSRLAVSQFQKQHGSDHVIVNIASLAGLYPQGLQPTYAAAKAGVVHFTRSLAKSPNAFNLRAVAVCPSFSPTSLLGKALTAFDGHQELHDRMTRSIETVVPVTLVIEAILLAITDCDRLNGAAIRVTPTKGIDAMFLKINKAASL